MQDSIIIDLTTDNHTQESLVSAIVSRLGTAKFYYIGFDSCFGVEPADAETCYVWGVYYNADTHPARNDYYANVSPVEVAKSLMKLVTK